MNRHIIKRFFFRKTSNNKTDKLLPLVFIIIIACSTSMISFNSLIIYKYKEQINQFAKNEWNKVYYLYLGDTDRNGVENYLTDMENRTFLKQKKGFRDYPKMIKIASKDTSISNILNYAFTNDFDYILNNLNVTIDDISNEPYLFLETNLMKRLQVNDGDLVFIKQSHIGNKYKQALIVKEVKNSSRFKSFIFQDYLGIYSKCNVRFYFKNFSEAFSFAVDLKEKDNIPLPYYFGYKDLMFGGFVNSYEKKSDFILPLNYIVEKNATTETISICDSLVINFSNIQDDLVINFDKNKPIIIDENQISIIVENQPNLDKVAIFQNTRDKFFIDISLQDNYNKINSLDTRLRKQLKIFDYCDICDSIAIVSENKALRRKNLNMFIYYNKLDSINLSEKILTDLNYKNVRWDSGRWSTIIHLNKSLKEGKRNSIILIIISLIIFILFLNTKFLLRLKLEYHTVGVLKCFGHENKTLYKIYILGYLILVIIGFIVGIVPLTYIVGLFSGYSIIFINHAMVFYIFNPVNFITGFLLFLIVTTVFSVSLNLYRKIKKDKIYELIKYEG